VRVLYAVICEDAEARADGRMDMHGVFHQLYAPGFPAQQERMVLAAAVEWNGGELGRQPFRIDLLDPNQTPVLTISGHTDVGPSAGGDAPPQTRLVMPLEGAVFPVAGTFVFHFYHGDAAIPIAPIHLIENPDAA
jgi:hypothetical protein